MARLLLAEDDAGILEPLARALTREGHEVDAVTDGQAAEREALGDGHDLLILDLGLPGRDGMDVLRELRATGHRLPVLILSARDDTVTGLDLGADDYMTKPFRFDELLARVRARLRTDGTAEETILRAGDLALDLRTRRAAIGGATIELSAREFTMLEVFLRHAGQVLSREQLLSHVWGYDYDPGSNVVDVYVGYLRRKLGHDRIETVRGMGYALAVSG
jgi:DNA-binding response OmpR family regulator